MQSTWFHPTPIWVWGRFPGVFKGSSNYLAWLKKLLPQIKRIFGQGRFFYLFWNFFLRCWGSPPPCLQGVSHLRDLSVGVMRGTSESSQSTQGNIGAMLLHTLHCFKQQQVLSVGQESGRGSVGSVVIQGSGGTGSTSGQNQRCRQGSIPCGCWTEGLRSSLSVSQGPPSAIATRTSPRGQLLCQLASSKWARRKPQSFVS